MKFSAPSLISSLNDIKSGFAYLGPEIILAVFFLLVVGFDLFKSTRVKAALPLISFIGILINMWPQVQALAEPVNYSKQVFFTGLLTSDGLAIYAGLLFSVAGLFTLLLTWFHPALGKNFRGIGEYNAYLLVLLIGLNLMVKSVNLLMLFVAIELVSIASYLLTASLKYQRAAIESGLKYILYGILASGVMLYGMSFMYGFGGSLNFTDTNFWVNLTKLSSAFFIIIFLLTFAGFLFKIAAAPFHFWVPDVYAGAPAPIVAFFATAPKIAGFIIIIRFLNQISRHVAPALQNDLIFLVGGITLLTLVVGNFTALWQGQARRLLAYSSVAQAGFVLAPLAALASNSLEAVLFYLTMLLFMNFGIFLVVQVFEEKFQIKEIKDLSGLGRLNPVIGILALIFLISLIGLPPTAGFTGKLLMFTNLWQNYNQSGNQLLLSLLMAGLALTAVAFFYYIRIPYFMFFKRNLTVEKKVLVARENIILTLFALPLLLFFFQPAWLIHIIEQVIFYTK